MCGQNGLKDDGPISRGFPWKNHWHDGWKYLLSRRLSHVLEKKRTRLLHTAERLSSPGHSPMVSAKTYETDLITDLQYCWRMLSSGTLAVSNSYRHTDKLIIFRPRLLSGIGPLHLDYRKRTLRPTKHPKLVAKPLLSAIHFFRTPLLYAHFSLQTPLH